MLYILNETFTNGPYHTLLGFISMASVLCGILVIISKNPIVSVLFLIGLFFTIAIYLMMLGINFIGLSYLLVYVGAVSILFLFILMLINIRVSELVTDSSNSIPLAIFIGTVFIFIFQFLLLSNIVPVVNTATLSTGYGLNTINNSNVFNMMLSYYNNKYLSFVTSQIWDGSLSESSHITSLGNVIYTAYPMWLIITSIILLLAMVGAIVITIKSNDKFASP